MMSGYGERKCVCVQSWRIILDPHVDVCRFDSDRGNMPERVAIALSGGGSKGDFQVGVLRYLYETGVRPDIVTGSSVGAINALKLAEGDGPDGNAQQRLEHFWRQLEGDSDMYELEAWVQTIHDLRIQQLFTRGHGTHGASAVASWLRLPALLVSGLIASGVSIESISDAIDKAAAAQSIFNLGPVERLLKESGAIDPQRVLQSGIALRLSMVGLESGQLRHVNERGEISGVEADPVELLDAAIASSSIPLMFPPRMLAGEHYVDGGVREILPLQPAIDAGASVIFAITATQASLPVESITDQSLIGIGMRAIGDLMVDELTEGDIRTGLTSGNHAQVHIIRPTVDVHDIITIQRGLIDISIDYGYMRAGDHLEVSEGDRVAAMELSDRITRLRMECWELEESVSTSVSGRIKTVADRSSLAAIRAAKRSIYEAVDQRIRLGAPVPERVERLWLAWELHLQPLSPQSPWDRIFTTFGPLPDEAPPG
jgi:NTE family protein